MAARHTLLCAGTRRKAAGARALTFTATRCARRYLLNGPRRRSTATATTAASTGIAPSALEAHQRLDVA